MSQKGLSILPVVVVIVIVIFVVIAFVLVAIFLLSDDDEDESNPDPTPFPPSNACSLYPTPSNFDQTDYYLDDSVYYTAQAGGSGSTRQCVIPDNLRDFDSFEAEFQQSALSNDQNGVVGWVVTNKTTANYSMFGQFWSEDGPYFQTRFVRDGDPNSIYGWTNRPLNLEPNEWPVLYNDQSYYFSIDLPGFPNRFNIGYDSNGNCLMAPSASSGIELINITISLDSTTQQPIITVEACTTSKMS